jgi:hypothetical protein
MQRRGTSVTLAEPFVVRPIAQSEAADLHHLTRHHLLNHRGLFVRRAHALAM